MCGWWVCRVSRLKPCDDFGVDSGEKVFRICTCSTQLWLSLDDTSTNQVGKTLTRSGFEPSKVLQFKTVANSASQDSFDSGRTRLTQVVFDLQTTSLWHSNVIHLISLSDWCPLKLVKSYNGRFGVTLLYRVRCTSVSCRKHFSGVLCHLLEFGDTVL